MYQLLETTFCKNLVLVIRMSLFTFIKTHQNVSGEEGFLVRRKIPTNGGGESGTLRESAI